MIECVFQLNTRSAIVWHEYMGGLQLIVANSLTGQSERIPVNVKLYGDIPRAAFLGTRLIFASAKECGAICLGFQRWTPLDSGDSCKSSCSNIKRFSSLASPSSARLWVSLSVRSILYPPSLFPHLVNCDCAGNERRFLGYRHNWLNVQGLLMPTGVPVASPGFSDSALTNDSPSSSRF